MWKLFCIISGILLTLEIAAAIYIGTCPIEQVVHLGSIIPKPLILIGMYMLYYVLYYKILLMVFGLFFLAFYGSVVYEEKQTEKYMNILEKHHLR